MEAGGELARNLKSLYDYATVRLTQDNLRKESEPLERGGPPDRAAARCLECHRDRLPS
jgi:hypothetical protein